MGHSCDFFTAVGPIWGVCEAELSFFYVVVEIITGISIVGKRGHSGEYGDAAKLVGKMSKSVMQLISIYF